MSPFWILLELRMMAVMVTTRAIRYANYQIITTNEATSRMTFYRLDALPDTQPTVSKH